LKKILYIGGFELPDKNAAAQRVIANAKALEKIGYEVLFLGVTKNKEKVGYQFFENFKYLEKKYPHSLFQWISYLISIKEVVRIIKENKGIDVIICYNYPAIALYKLKRYCREENIKIFADVTEWYKGEGNLIKRVVKNIDTYLRMVKIHPKLDGVIVISKYLENFYKNKLKVIYIPPLVDINDKKWCRDSIENNGENKLNLIYAGSPGKSKDKLDKIILALKKINLDKIKLKIIGLTEEEFRSNYPKFSDELNKENIEFLGRISHKNVLEILKKADFSIFYREKNRVTMAGFPTKFVESISAKIPVITSRTSDLENYLIDGENGFWLEENIEISLEKILAENFEKLKRMKEKVNNKEFDYENYLNKFSELLDDN
jgi:glycosyltransferase involved in cell wall biosynthesis